VRAGYDIFVRDHRGIHVVTCGDVEGEFASQSDGGIRIGGAQYRGGEDVTILVINSGSSSIKFALFDHDARTRLGDGEVTRIGEAQSRFSLRFDDRSSAGESVMSDTPVVDHEAGLRLIFDAVERAAVTAIGHRVVHGGASFTGPVAVDAQVLQAIRGLEPLAPLHNPPNALGIAIALARYPALPQVAVFDTAFHHRLPQPAFRYAVPESWYTTHGVRRYGFHGTSHAYLVRRAAALLERPADTLNLITLHLGNGASVAAVRGGVSVDTSMGFTPLEGLMMGTRAGDLDPAVPLFLQRHGGLDADEVETALNHHSGLKGIAGVNDMREVLRLRAAGEVSAQLAFEMFCYRVRKYLGAYTAVLETVDAVVFAGGIGTHQAVVREHCCDGLARLGIDIDPQRNRAARDGAAIQAAHSDVAVLVVETDEEHEIALQTRATLSANNTVDGH